MNILLTGSNGFLGSFLRKRFEETDWSIIPFEGDLLSINDLKPYFDKNVQWDFVIHLAGIGNVPACEQDMVRAYQVNTIATCLLVDQIKKYSPQAQLIFASTGQVYDLLHGLEAPVDESHDVCPSNTYARSKRAAELYIEDTFRSFRSSYVILRIFNHSHKSQRPDFFMPSIYQQILEKRKQGSPVLLDVGNIQVERDIGSIQDLIEAFFSIVKNRNDGHHIFNLSSGTGKKLDRVVDELSRAMDIQVETRVDPSRVRKNDPPRMIASTEKLKNVYGWSPRYAENEVDLVQSFLSELENS